MEHYSTSDLTEIDRNILRVLQHDASLSVSAVARQSGLSRSACWRRMSKLEEEGFIRGRVALLDAERLEFPVVVFVNVRLAAHADQTLRDFEKAICEFPEVTECYTMTGTMDFLLRIVVRDIHAYEEFFRQHLSRMPAVQEVHSSVAITQLKYTTELPI